MKIILVLMLCGLVATQAKVVNPNPVELSAGVNNVEDRNWLIDQAVNALIRQLIEFIRRLINNGSETFGIPVLDPLVIDKLNIYLPAGLVNLQLYLKDAEAKGIGGFVVHRSRLLLSDLSFDVDISVPSIDISAEGYDFLGDLLEAIPIYGLGKATFKVDELRFAAKLYLRQSDDGTAVIIDRIEDISFRIPSLKSGLTGVIGGGDIDAVVNAIVEDVVLDYVNRFQGFIGFQIGRVLPLIANPTLEQLDTWRFLAPLVRP